HVRRIDVAQERLSVPPDELVVVAEAGGVRRRRLLELQYRRDELGLLLRRQILDVLAGEENGTIRAGGCGGEWPGNDDGQERDEERQPTHRPSLDRLPAGGIPLHPAGVGCRRQLSILARDGAHAAERPWLPHREVVATRTELPDRLVAKPLLHRQRA